MIQLLGELPDLWDITVHDYSYEMGTSTVRARGRT